MTWTLTHTIADANTGSGTAESHTAMQYLFDTYLPAKGWTSAAHPDASAFKRSVSRTTAANAYGETLTMRYWANWFNVTPISMNLYTDVTYTSTPGDLGTSVENFTQVLFNSPSNLGAGAAWKFWSSDQDASATLVTRGKKVYWYMPGLQSNVSFLLVDSTWDGSSPSRTTHIFPMTNGYQPRACGLPLEIGSGSYYINPMVGSINSFSTTESYFMVSNLSWYATKSSAYNDGYSEHVYNTGSDVLYVKNTIDNYTNNFWTSSNQENCLLLSNAKYYLCTNSATSLSTVGGNGAIAFDMGASEPDFS